MRNSTAVFLFDEQPPQEGERKQSMDGTSFGEIKADISQRNKIKDRQLSLFTLEPSMPNWKSLIPCASRNSRLASG
jgi:hypothetical protein